jgi:hypothetical protein
MVGMINLETTGSAIDVFIVMFVMVGFQNKPKEKMLLKAVILQDEIQIDRFPSFRM